MPALRQTVGGRATSARPPEAKLAKSEEARKLQQSLLNNGTAIAKEAIRVIGLLALVQKIAEAQGDTAFAQLLTLWKADLEGLKAKLTTVDGLTGLKSRLTAGWLEIPKAFAKNLKASPKRQRPGLIRRPLLMRRLS